MSDRRAPILYAALTATALITIGIVLRSRENHATPEPTDAQLEVFLRLVPKSFAELIAMREAETPIVMRPVPIAVGLPDGATIRIVAPKVTPDLDPESDLGGSVQDGIYEPPRVRRGSAIDRFNARQGDRRRVLRLVVMGTQGRRTPITAGHPGVVFSAGTSTKRDLGPLTAETGQVRVPAEGASSDGFILILREGAPLRRISLAPEELGPSTQSEPGGYALLYDEVTVTRTEDPYSQQSSTVAIGPAFPPPFERLWTKTAQVTGHGETFFVTGLVHVYRQREGRWRYSRSWSLIGDARTTFSSDEVLYVRARRLTGQGPVAFGVPKILIPLRASPLVPGE